VLLALASMIVMASGCTKDKQTANAGVVPNGTDTGLPSITFTTAKGQTVALAVEVADDSEEMQCGLMHRTSLPADQGMIFLYQMDSSGGFWMRNTLISLSIAYVAADGRIVDILDMEPVLASKHTPYRLPDGSMVAVADGQPVPAGAVWLTYPPRGPYRSAIEVNRGWFGANGIAIGDRVNTSAVSVGGSAGQPPMICREQGV